MKGKATKNFIDLRQGDVIKRTIPHSGTSIFVVNKSAKKDTTYKNEWTLIATCLQSTGDYFKFCEEYPLTSVIRNGKLSEWEYLGTDYKQFM